MSTLPDVKKAPVTAQAIPDACDLACGDVVDIGKPSDFVLNSEVDDALSNYVPETDVEKRLRRKADLYLLPMLWIMCVMCYIDRNNIGNADAAGMSKDLGMEPSQYSMLITIFFIAYCSWEVPSNLILAKARPRLYLPSLMVIWGAIVTSLGAVQSYSHLLVCRFFLGIIEAGFFPGVLYIFTCWYKRNEIGKRWCFFYTALCVSGAASGLIAGAVISGLEGRNGRKGWRWLFIIEGIVSMAVGIVAYFVLLDYPTTKDRRFTEEERKIATVRIMHDRAQIASPKRKLKTFESVKAALSDLRCYVFIVLFMLQNGSGTISYFIPTVVKSMGYTGAMQQWMSVPIWATGIVYLLIIPSLSDRTGNRQWFIVAGLCQSFVSAIVCNVSKVDAVRYTFLCFYIAGLYTVLPLILAWVSETINQPPEKRAVVIAFVNCVGSISSIYGGYLWPSTDAPNYTKGFSAVSTFLGIGTLMAATLPIIVRFLLTFQTKAMREIEAED